MAEKISTHDYRQHPKITECAHAFTFSSTVAFSGTVSFTGDINLGDTSADTLTVNGTLACTSNVGMTFTDDEALTITTTDTTAGASAPLVMTTTLSGAGVTGGRALFHTKFNVAVGAWVNALKGYLEITGTSGYTSGLASAVVAEMKFAAKASLSGAYYPLEIEVVCPATFSIAGDGGSNAGFIYARVSGTTTNWEDKAWFMRVVDLTAASGNMLSANSQTLRCAFGTQGTPVERYMVFSQLQDALSLDGCATAITLGNSVTTTGIQIGDVPTGILLDGDFTDAIKIAGSNTIVDGIEIGACTTNAINIAAQTTTGIKFAGDAAYNPIHIGTKANTATGGLNMNGQDSYDNHGGIMMFCDDGGVALATTYTTSAIWTRYLITTSQTSNTHTGAYLQMKSLAATYTTCDTSAAKVYFETAGAITLASGSLSVINAGLELGGVFTDTAEALTGVDVNINDGTNALDTAKASAGVRIRKTSGSTAGFPIGLYIENSGATTGIKIGTATVGITLTGTVTNGIDLTGATLTQAIDNALLSIGSYSNAKAVTVTDHYIPLQIVLTNDGNVDKTLSAAYFKVGTAGSTALMQYVTQMIRMNIDNPTESCYGIQAHLTFGSSGTATTECIGVSAAIDNTSATPGGLVWGLKSEVKGTNSGTTQAAIFSVTGAGASTQNIRCENLTGSTITSLLHLQNAGTCGDVMLVHGTYSHFANFDNAATCVAVITGAATTVANQILVKMLNGSTGYINVYSSTGS